ncbi:MAG: BLUF domain-containing protein [Pseudomonadota bacterium]
MLIHRLIYVSRRRDGVSEDELRDIADVSLARNSTKGITGYLYFDSESFIQEIEGVEADVAALYRSICSDGRHEGIRTVLAQDSETRVFGEWTMAFHDGDKDGGLLQKTFGSRAPASLDESDGEQILRFLRNLSIGSAEIIPVAQTDPLTEA